MDNSAILNYDTKTLVVTYNGLTYTFNLADGDATDYWNTFQLKDFKEKDINFSIDEYNEVGVLNGQLCVYDMIEGQLTNDEIIPIIEAIGDINNFAGYDPKEEKVFIPVKPTLSFSQSDIEDMQSKIANGGGHAFTWSVEIEGKTVDIEIVTE